MALANFPRIVGLRDGAVMFDLPSAQVTPERLEALYAQHLDELKGVHAVLDLPPEPKPAAVAMTCR